MGSGGIPDKAREVPASAWLGVTDVLFLLTFLLFDFDSYKISVSSLCKTSCCSGGEGGIRTHGRD